MGSFWANYILLSFMTLESDEKLACCLENDMRNFANFYQSTWKCQNWNFDKIFLSKVENVWASNLQWSFVSWQWRVTQKFKRNWLVVLKLTWTSQILTWTLEKSKKGFCFNWLLVTKVYIVWAIKVQRSYLFWHWGVMQTLKKDWPVVWKKTRNLANFHQSTWKCKNWNFDGILLSKVEKVWT